MSRTLADALNMRFEWLGDGNALDEALRLADRAVEEATRSPHRARYLSLRAALRDNLFRHRDERHQFDAALADAQAAVEAARRHDQEDSEYVNHLTMLWAERFDLYGDSADLDRAIGLAEPVLARRALPADARAPLATNLAQAYLSCFELDESRATLDRAVDLVEQAIAATDPRSSELAARHNAAGLALARRALVTGAPEDSDRARQHGREAVRLEGRDSPDRKLYLNNLAVWLLDAWESGAGRDALDESIAVLTEAYEQTDTNGALDGTVAYNLARALAERHEAQNEQDGPEPSLDDLQKAVDLWDEVLAGEWPHLSVYAGQRLGDIAFQMGMWDQADHALRLAMEAARDLTIRRGRRTDKERARSGVQGIGAVAALAACRSGRDREVAVRLEQSSATLLAETFAGEAAAISFDDIVGAAERLDRSVLYFAATSIGGICAAVTARGHVECVELPMLTIEAVQERSRALHAAFEAVPQHEEQLPECVAGDEPDWFGLCDDAVCELLAWTSMAVLAPLHALLVKHDRIAVIQAGPAAWLPLLAAASQHSRPLFTTHEAVCLVNATARRLPLAAAAGPVTGRVPRVVIWADTGPEGWSIPNVVDEAIQIASCYAAPDLRINDRSRALVQHGDALVLRGRRPVSRAAHAPDAEASELALAKLLSSDIAHLACHCDIDLDEPANTLIHTIPPISLYALPAPSTSPGAHLVLSACNGALTATHLPDEALSPATAFLLAGAGSVCAPLWPVDDATTPDFMTAYHQRLAAGEPAISALAATQRDWQSEPALSWACWTTTMLS
jgi:tetratricopeptide (TPR) repeat protein